MGYADVNMTVLKKLKSKDLISIKCDNCGCENDHLVKRVRLAIKAGTKQTFCNLQCKSAYYTKINTRLCEHCNNEFVKKHKEQNFCSKSCSNTYTNLNRKHSDETKKKISNALSNKKFSPKCTSKKFHKLYKDENYSKLYFSSCLNCGFKGAYKNDIRYCKKCQNEYSENGRTKYNFTFNVYKYPDLFDVKLLEEYGWYRTKGKNKNLSGLSRDHKVSVNEAKKYKYDSYYIKHPINCELMFHCENKSKGTNSSITYEELVKLVDEYDKKSN